MHGRSQGKETVGRMKEWQERTASDAEVHPYMRVCQYVWILITAQCLQLMQSTRHNW